MSCLEDVVGMMLAAWGKLVDATTGLGAEHPRERRGRGQSVVPGGRSREAVRCSSACVRETQVTAWEQLFP